MNVEEPVMEEDAAALLTNFGNNINANNNSNSITGNLDLELNMLNSFLRIAGKRGRKEKPFEKLSQRSQFDKLDILVSDCMIKFSFSEPKLAVEKSLIEDWHESKIPGDIKTLIGIGRNVIKLKETLPKTSTSQTAIINSACEGIF